MPWERARSNSWTLPPIESFYVLKCRKLFPRLLHFNKGWKPELISKLALPPALHIHISLLPHSLWPQKPLEKGRGSCARGDLACLLKKPTAAEANESGLDRSLSAKKKKKKTFIIKCPCLLKPLSTASDSWEISLELQACHLTATQNINLLGFFTLLTAQSNQTELQL